MPEPKVDIQIHHKRYLPIDRLSYANDLTIEENIERVRNGLSSGRCVENSWYILEKDIRHAIYTNLFDRYRKIANRAMESGEKSAESLFNQSTEEDISWLTERLCYGLNIDSKNSLELAHSLMKEARDDVAFDLNMPMTEKERDRRESATKVLMVVKILMFILVSVKLVMVVGMDT